MLANMQKEYDKFKKRFDKVGDPSYALDLRSKIAEVKEKIHKLEEAKRDLKHEKFGRERKMNQVIMEGQPDAMLEIQTKVKEMTVLFDRLAKLNKKLKFQQETKDQADELLKEKQDALQEIETKAQQEGVDFNTETSNQSITDSFMRDPRTYSRKTKVIQQAIEANKTKYGK